MINKDNWKERILSQVSEHAADLVFEDFKAGRINKLVDSGELTLDEIGQRFTERFQSCMEIIKEEMENES